MILVLFFSIFLLMLLIPFLPGIMEMVRPQDSSPLYINMNYSKDPRYFGTSFRSILKKELMTSDLEEGLRTIQLSKEETVEFAAKKIVDENSRINHMLYITGNFLSRERCVFDKEIYVGGKATISEACEIRALAADGPVSLGSKTSVLRWVDSEAGITAEGRCDLGWSISCQKRLKIGPECQFRRLFGMPIVTTGKSVEEHTSSHESIIRNIGDTAMSTDSKCLIIPPSTRINRVIIAKQNLLIKHDCVLHGDIKTYGHLVLEEGVKIDGNVFAEKDIEIGAGSKIVGNIFSQGSLKIGSQTKIGRAGMTKSVVSRRGIVIHGDVSIFGYVLTGKKGMVL